MKRLILVFAFLVTLTGCVTKPTKPGDRSVYRLDGALSWTASTPLGSRTLWVEAGLYVAILEDEEGIFQVGSLDQAIAAFICRLSPRKELISIKEVAAVRRFRSCRLSDSSRSECRISIFA